MGQLNLLIKTFQAKLILVLWMYKFSRHLQCGNFLVFSGQLRKSPDFSGLLLFVFALFSPKSLCFWIWVACIYGGSEGDWTLYLLHIMEALSQVSKIGKTPLLEFLKTFSVFQKIGLAYFWGRPTGTLKYYVFADRGGSHFAREQGTKRTRFSIKF